MEAAIGNVIKMYEEIRHIYCWKNFTKDIEEYRRLCEYSQKDSIKRKFRVPGTYIDPPNSVNEIWYLDHANPKNGNYYFFIIDGLSLYLQVYKLLKLDESSYNT